MFSMLFNIHNSLYNVAACEFVRAWEARAASAACSWLGSLAAVRPASLEPRAPLLTHTALRCIGMLNHLTFL